MVWHKEGKALFAKKDFFAISLKNEFHFSEVHQNVKTTLGHVQSDT